ncbi:hypothetical protein PSP6_130188 [Paraburkholderia tropica]|nr:hypothetical protein [Paraburkholderia tropica]CAG9193149.1 hypothetical protein PSP6_130188 [Paraburkholderia tropica]
MSTLLGHAVVFAAVTGFGWDPVVGKVLPPRHTARPGAIIV